MTPIVQKIRKLLALSEGSAGAEAATAAAMAHKLMRKHAIEQSALDEAALLAEDPLTRIHLPISRASWTAQLGWALATHCNVRALRGSRWYDDENGVSFKRQQYYLVGYGHASDLAIWEYLYSVAHREIERLAKEYIKAEKERYGYVTRTEMSEWRVSAVAGLRTKLYRMRREARAEPGGSKTALVLQSRAQRALAYQESRCTAGRNYRSTVSAGSAAGRAAGASINLRSAIARGPSATKYLKG
jgi:hypothetical protein